MVALEPAGAYSQDIDAMEGPEMITLKSTSTVWPEEVMRYILSLTSVGTLPGTFTMSVWSVM